MRSHGVFTTDAHLVVQSWNDWLAEHTGIAASTVIGQPLPTILPDLAERHLLGRFEQALAQGVVEVLAPALHHYLVSCPPSEPTPHFALMQQRVTIVPLRKADHIVGLEVTLEDVTAQLVREREITEQLQSPNEQRRLLAAQALANTASENPSLFEALGDTSWRVRQVAVTQVGQHAGAEAVADVLRAMRDEHRDLSLLNSALQVLALTEIDVTAALIDFLAAPDGDLRIYAALALADHPGPRTTTALLRAIHDADPNVAFHAIEALGKLRPAAAIDDLVQIAQRRDFALSFAAIEALRLIGASHAAIHLLPLLDDQFLRNPVIEALGILGDSGVVGPLAQLLNNPDPPVLMLVQALTTLYERYETQYAEGDYIADQAREQITAGGVQALLATLDAAAPSELRQVCKVLGWLHNPQAEAALARLISQPELRAEVLEALIRSGARVTPVLSSQLGDPDAETRAAAAMALGRIGTAQAVPQLIALLQDEAAVAIVAAGALAKIGDHQAFEPLLDLLGTPEPALRQAAIAALHSLGHPALETRVIALLTDPEPIVRESAVRIAGYFGWAGDHLLAATTDPDERVQCAAVEQLAYLEDQIVLPTLTELLNSAGLKVRRAVVRALANVEAEGIAPLLQQALADPDSWVRFFAVRAIGQQAASEALDLLAGLLTTDPAGQVRIAITETLGQLGGQRAVALLAPLLSAADLDQARAAVCALGQIADPSALPPLLTALHSRNVPLQQAALEAFVERGGDQVVAPIQWLAVAGRDPELQAAALAGLGQLGSTKAVDALIALLVQPEQRAAASEVLAHSPAVQISALGRGLSHAHPAVRSAMVQVLARRKSAAATELITTALADLDANVRLAAITALRDLGTHRAQSKLALLAYDDPDLAVRQAAQAIFLH